MVILNKLGWPIETVTGRPILNFIRYVIHGRMIISDDLWDTLVKNLNNKGTDDSTQSEDNG